ncbi:MAG TPA: MarR family transcriptional regulator [Saprospiraceae bacterium]|nr:MarR family transcriptional regulator [Saprospiraceae bacterium]MCB9328766.1 MarR family transcriptional regulator [Lewinellaceae bacterium]HPK09506.1 MarR family transcriptional regulator [Saprospiraceae bacterium]HPQ21214.1 MarR family transcriptional regulator [Saprospiraceae bacterium]HRX27878.1 MarR family transcriptional regulator [Saprospiraceae bacterium]
MLETAIEIKKYEMYGHRLERTAKMMKLYFSRFLNNSDAGVTVDQYVISSILHKNGIMSQQDLAEMSHKDAPTVTRILDIMVEKNLIDRIQDANDRRKFAISLTDTGIEKYRNLEQEVDIFRSECYHGLDDADLEVFSRCLDKIFDNLTKAN